MRLRTVAQTNDPVRYSRAIVPISPLYHGSFLQSARALVSQIEYLRRTIAGSKRKIFRFPHFRSLQNQRPNEAVNSRNETGIQCHRSMFLAFVCSGERLADREQQRSSISGRVIGEHDTLSKGAVRGRTRPKRYPSGHILRPRRDLLEVAFVQCLDCRLSEELLSAD